MSASPSSESPLGHSPSSPPLVVSPPNGWIVYGSAASCIPASSRSSQPVALANLGLPQGDLSKRVAQAWKAESDAVKAHFYALASQRQEERELAYPDSTTEAALEWSSCVNVALLMASAASGESTASWQQHTTNQANMQPELLSLLGGGDSDSSMSGAAGMFEGVGAPTYETVTQISGFVDATLSDALGQQAALLLLTREDQDDGTSGGIEGEYLNSSSLYIHNVVDMTCKQQLDNEQHADLHAWTAWGDIAGVAPDMVLDEAVLAHAGAEEARADPSSLQQQQQQQQAQEIAFTNGLVAASQETQEQAHDLSQLAPAPVPQQPTPQLQGTFTEVELLAQWELLRAKQYQA